MSSQIKIKPRVDRLINIIDMIDKGNIKIPSFQRDYVWTKKQRIELFDSIQLEYPIGAILLWKPTNEFKINHELGPFTIKETNSNDFFYILDGFQRLSTLFGSLINPKNTNHEINRNKLIDFSIHYDLEKEEFNIPRAEPIDITNIPIHTLIDSFEFFDYADRIRGNQIFKENANKLIIKGKKLSSTLIDYHIPYVEIHGGDIEQAVNIFSRVNSKGSKISLDWMVSALTNDESQDFNLGNSIESLLSDLKVYNFHDLKRKVILQCLQTSFGKIYFDFKLEELIKREDFIEKTKDTIVSVEKAVKFLFEEVLVLERRLLPYKDQLIFLSYFFYKIRKPEKRHLKKLKEWFWITTYSNYFTIYSLSKIRLAFDQFKEFVNDASLDPVFNDKPDLPFPTADFPTTIHSKSVRSTALVLFLLNYSNKFMSIEESEIDDLKLDYLSLKNKKPESLVPLIQFIENEKNLLKPGKVKDLSILLSDSYKDENLDAFFITRDMYGLELDEAIKLRKKLIVQAERKFVQKLDLTYS